MQDPHRFFFKSRKRSAASLLCRFASSTSRSTSSRLLCTSAKLRVSRLHRAHQPINCFHIWYNLLQLGLHPGNLTFEFFASFVSSALK